MSFDAHFLGRAEVKLNGQLLPADQIRITQKEEDGRVRRTWKFRIRVVGVESMERMNDLLENREMEFEVVGGDHIRAECNKTSWSYSGEHSPITVYGYQLELRELFDGEEASPAGPGSITNLLAEVFPLIIDLATGIAQRGLQGHELRLRHIEDRLDIDNSESVKRWAEAMDFQAEEGWIARFPHMAEDMKEEFMTQKVREVLEKWQAERPEDPFSGNSPNG